jgi:hypothetical protein
LSGALLRNNDKPVRVQAPNGGRQEEVGQQFSVTRERIRQIEARALRKLRQASGAVFETKAKADMARAILAKHIIAAAKEGDLDEERLAMAL